MRHLTLGGAVLALTSLVSAQGTYETFGSGCAGYCGWANETTTANSSLTQNSNIFALAVQPTAALRVVMGFELFTQSLGSSPLTIQTQIYAADATGKPTGSPIANGTMTIGTAQGWYRTRFQTPLIVNPNTKFFLSYTSVANQMKFPIANTGTKVSHFWHPASATTWNGTAPNGFITQNWAWKVVCFDGPELSNTGVPTLGTSMTVDLSHGGASNQAIFAFGVSDQTWGPVALPLDLTPLSAPCCKLYVSLEFQFLVTTDTTGNFSFKLNVPNDNTLKGLNFYNQYAIGAPGANGFGVLFTGGGKATIN